ncbi:MAG TPA: OmpA family protein [Aromatoleum sp.]|uniref:OmpA family protein n=1 Tax=Aromatoleum sp. TaxID=2307007 RepID=UPI002B46CB61|nr:OmpA family protein [Aromatoleum sp.]HJV26361.1 OmpA family protein [Aromatoleum sp.]
MPRLAALAACALIATLSACATPPAAPRPAAAVDNAGHVTLPTPKVDWPAERDRIKSALGGRADLSLAAASDEQQLRILVPGADAFARDEAAPKAGLRTTLDKIASVLAVTAETEIVVIGHTDSLGSETYNLQLSIRRAEAVVEYIRTRGIALSRLVADGRGEAEPIADNGNETGRARNRRIEIVVRPFK